MKGLLLCVLLLVACACRGEDLSSHAIKTNLVEQAVLKLCSDSRFQERLQAFRDSQERHPRLQVTQIENCSAERSSGVASLRDHLMARLRTTELFELLPDEQMDMASGRDVSIYAVEWPAEDWRLIGRYRTLQDGNRKSFELFLQIIDVSKMMVVWNDVAVIAMENAE